MYSSAQVTYARLTRAPGLTVSHGPIETDFTSGLYTVDPFNRAVVSWNARGAARFELHAGGKWHAMGFWSDKPASNKSATVDVDLLTLPKPATSFRFRAIPEPGSEISLVAVTHWMKGETRGFYATPSLAWGKTLPVPERSQFAEKTDASRICSPTSLAMVLEYHGIKRTTREVAEGVYDHAAKIYGNWPFNTAHAHRVSGLETYVRRCASIEELEDEILADRPAIVSHCWKRGELTGAPLPESKGHLIVVVGFTDWGDIVVNDPAGRPGKVRRIYKRPEFHRTWLINGSGIMYVLQ